MDDFFTALLVILIAFSIGRCTSCSEAKHDIVKCEADGMYMVKLDDEQTNERIWVKTNRKCTPDKQKANEKKEIKPKPIQTKNEQSDFESEF